jgi:5'-3' exonuclease
VTTRLLLDTSSLMYRAFFALPTTITDGRDHPVNALHGYLDMCARLVRDRKPGAVVHCFDHDWKPAPRVAAYDGYKAARPPDPDGLPEQFDVLRHVLDATGMTLAEAPGWEAEDAIGSLCARSGRRDRIDIVTGDRDLIQCVRDPAVRVLFTRRGVSELDVLDEAAVETVYGVPATRYADFATLRGDPSDGLPGVRGVGEKTARALVRAYPSLEAMEADARAERARAGPLRGSPGLKARIREAAGYLSAMRNVVPIRTDLDVQTQTGTRDDSRLDTLARRWSLTGPIGRLRSALDEAGTARGRPGGRPRTRGSG